MASHKVLVVTASVLLASSVAPHSRAQDDYPNRPLRIVVGFTPGGGPDITARHIAQRLSERLSVGFGCTQEPDSSRILLLP